MGVVEKVSAIRKKRKRTNLALQKQSLNINAKVAGEVLRRDLADQFRTLLVLKTVAKGNGAYFVPEKNLQEKIARIRDCSTRTVRRELQRLRDLGWIGVDENGVHYIRSFDFIRRDLGVKSRTIHKINVWFCAGNGLFFRAVLLSIFLGKIVANRRFALVRNTSRTHQRAGPHSYDPGNGEQFSPDTISVSFLANRLQKSKATIHRWKTKALEADLIDREKGKYEFENETNVSRIKRAFPENAYRTYLSYESGCVCVRLADEINVKLKYKNAPGH